MIEIDTSILRSTYPPSASSTDPYTVISQLCDALDEARKGWESESHLCDAARMELGLLRDKYRLGVHEFDWKKAWEILEQQNQKLAADYLLTLETLKKVSAIRDEAQRKLRAIEAATDEAEKEAGKDWPDGVTMWTTTIYEILGIDIPEKLRELFGGDEDE